MEKESKSTPGPWEVSDKFPTHVYKWKDKNTFYIVATCDCHGKTEIDIANAELIARAPELLQQVAELTKENADLLAKVEEQGKEIAELKKLCADQYYEIKELKEDLLHARTINTYSFHPKPRTNNEDISN